MSEENSIELAIRQLGIEIQKLIKERDMLLEDWKAMINQIEQLEIKTVSNVPKGQEQFLSLMSSLSMFLLSLFLFVIKT